MKVIKTEGTKTSLGSFMVIDDNGDDFCDEEGNNAWDTYEEADRVIGIYMNTLKLPYNKTIAIIKELSISVACMLDDSNDWDDYLGVKTFKQKDVEHIQDLVTKLEKEISA